VLPFNKSWPHLKWNLGYEGARTRAATRSPCVQGGERDGWGSSPGVSLDIVHGGGCRWWRKALWRSGGRGRYEAADQGSASFRNIQAASLPRWGLSEVLASRPYGRGSMRRGAGSGDRPLILWWARFCSLFCQAAVQHTCLRTRPPFRADRIDLLARSSPSQFHPLAAAVGSQHKRTRRSLAHRLCFGPWRRLGRSRR